MILMNDFRAEPVELRQAMLGAVGRVLESGWYVLGNEVTSFEKQWAKTCGVSYGVGVGNGMDAIEIVLRGLGIGPGDEVITTPMTAFASILAILRTGATPVLADIDPATALLSMASVKRCVSRKTKAILLVHLYGQLREMDLWVALCNEAGINLIEDCAQSHLASWGGEVSGGFGVAGAYSFYPTKNLGAIGDAGMIITRSESLAERAKCLRNYGQSIRYYHTELGLNSRLDEIQAAMLSERLEWLPKFTERRQKIAQIYRNEICNAAVQFLAEPEESAAHVYHLFVVLCAQRERLQSHLEINNIQTHIHYPIPVHMQEPCRQIAYDPWGLPNSEQHADQCLSLPCHPQLTDEQVRKVVEVINDFRA